MRINSIPFNEYENREHQGLEGDAPRVARGGSWINSRDNAPFAARDDYSPRYRNNDLGFWLVCVASIAEPPGAGTLAKDV